MVEDIFLKFPAFSLFPLAVVFRLFPPGPSLPSPSSSFRFFEFHSSLIACALRTRAADFGIASFRNDSFPGANSDPLKNKEYLEHLDSKVQIDITFPYGSVRGSFSLRVCVAFSRRCPTQS